MDIELKWEEFQKETQKVVEKTKISKSFVFFTLFCIGMLLFGLLFKIVLMIFSFGLITALCIGYGLIASFYLENKIEERRKQFFCENKEQIYNLQIDETFELTDVLQEHEKKIFLIIASEIRGRRKQTFHFSTKSKNGHETRVYEKDNESEYFYHQINEFKNTKPRLEVKAYKFASKSLENEFNTFISSHLRYCYQYTFFVPEGSVKKLFV